MAWSFTFRYNKAVRCSPYLSLALFLFNISPNLIGQAMPAETFVFQSAFGGLQLELKTDSTFSLCTQSCNTWLIYSGEYKYQEDTLLLDASEWMWEQEPLLLQELDGERQEPDVEFEFHKFIRKGDRLFLFIDDELIETNFLEKN